MRYKNGTRFLYVDKYGAGDVSGDVLKRERYIGSSGEFIFLYDPKCNAVSVLKFDFIKYVRLIQFDARAGSKSAAVLKNVEMVPPS